MSALKIQQWLVDQPEVESADCQLVYFPEGYCKRSPKTILITELKWADGGKWFDICERTGGDYRNSVSERIENTFKIVFQRMIDGR